jgi:hypothetical protein
MTEPLSKQYGSAVLPEPVRQRTSSRNHNQTTSTGYQPDFDIDLKRGQDGEQHVANILTGPDSTVEVKRDFGAERTGNVYIETHQLSPNGERWQPSGILKTKAEWWAFCGPQLDGFILVNTNRLRQLAAEAPIATQPIRDNKTNASAGRLVKVADIVATIMGS